MVNSIQEQLLRQGLNEKALWNGHSGEHFYKIKTKALKEFSSIGLPGSGMEEWKYTNLKQFIKNTEYQIEYHGQDFIIKPKHLIDEKYNLLVLVNGKYSKSLSNIKEQRNRMYLGGFEDQWSEYEILFEKYYGRSVNFLANPMYALNTAIAKDGVFMVIPDGVILNNPIHILNINTGQKNASFTQSRNLIIVGKNSQVNIVESYISADQNINFNNNACEIYVDEYAIFNYYKLQDISSKNILVDTTHVSQERSSVCDFYTFSSGGQMIRNDLNISLNDEYCETNMYGLSLAKNNEHIDHHTLIDHLYPNCNSNELYKGIYNDRARGVFNGKVYVRQDAQNTNAFQSNPNLLLSESARIDTKPQLEIYADDVKCSHGASVGQIDDESVFYMRSRGIDVLTARGILTNAFASEVIDSVKLDPLKESLRKKALTFFNLDPA